MKNYLKASIIMLIIGSTLVACTTNDVTEGDIITPELSEEQEIYSTIPVREKPDD